ncbi:hypothetical protein ACB092_09G083900 [Castanea dentata]
MVAHVGDFRSVNFLFVASNNPSKSQILSVGLKGSIGYIASEYGMGGQVSTLGDIYIYEILLLEMFIGKRSIDEMFKDGLSIHKFTAMALLEHVMDIVDPSMFFEKDEEDANDNIEEIQIIEEDPKECLISVFQIGLLCSKTSPDERIPINVVVNEMNAIRDKFLKLEKENRRRRGRQMS